MTRYNSKILLLGEYSIIKDGDGIALPFDTFSGEIFCHEETQTSEGFYKLYSYIKNSAFLSEALNLEGFKADLDKGLYFESNIPQGYGVGSSGALCANIFARYSREFERKATYTQDELKRLQDYMALMESFYHGSSSGLDCLISLINRPVLLKGRREIRVVEFGSLKEKGNFYLLDSGRERKTSPLVHQFLQKLESSNHYQDLFNEFKNQTNLAIKSFLDNDYFNFGEAILRISKVQLDLFSDMIPEKILDFWKQGLNTQSYVTKFCGAGGGGFFLVYAKDELNDPNLLEVKL